MHFIQRNFKRENHVTNYVFQYVLLYSWEILKIEQIARYRVITGGVGWAGVDHRNLHLHHPRHVRDPMPRDVSNKMDIPRQGRHHRRELNQNIL